MPSSVADNSSIDDYMDITTYSVWTNLALVIRKALAIIAGVKCTVREVREIKEAAQKFLDDAERCKNNVTDNVQSLVNACRSIVSLCDDIINANEKICGNTEEPSANDDKKTPKKCYKLLLNQVLELKDQVKDAISLIQIIINLPDETSKCAITAVKDLEKIFILFPIKMEVCSKLLHL